MCLRVGCLSNPIALFYSENYTMTYTCYTKTLISTIQVIQFQPPKKKEIDYIKILDNKREFKNVIILVYAITKKNKLKY